MPTGFSGTTLYALNALKDVLPEVYATQSTKYRGRDDILSQEIPYLGCGWNDVLHFSSVHPAQIRGAVESVGFAWKPMDWFEVDVVALGFSKENSVLYTSPFRQKAIKGISDEDFVPFSLETLAMLNSIPQAAYEYFNHAKAHDQRPVLFNCVPHVLYHGAIDTSGDAVTRITV
ncbi:MAG: hypothetical protein EA396_08020 [Anaerolineaceae bacterium]|nr:MAG: hypothetical protein EA396_08020 [Anaerolineaceae bacterium]